MIVKKLTIPEELVVQAPTTEGHKNYGTGCFLAHSAELEAALKKEYERDGLCLKVFKDGNIEKPEQFRYGGARIEVCTTVQNFFASHGLAPRVYDVAVVNKGYLVQVVEYATGEGVPDITKAKHIVRKYKIAIKLHGLAVPDPYKGALKYVAIPYKWIGGLFVDFGRFVFKDPDHIRTYLKKRVRGSVLPQNAESVDFNGKTVLDLDGGNCQMALERGAARVVAVDPGLARVQQMANDWSGYWNLEILPLNLPDEKEAIKAVTGIEQFDIVFASEYGAWVADLTKETLLFRGEGDQSSLEENFGRVEPKDDGFRCYKMPKPLPRGKAARRKVAIERGQAFSGQDPKVLGFLYDMAAIAPKGNACEVGGIAGLVTWAAARTGKKYIVNGQGDLEYWGYKNVKMVDSIEKAGELAFCLTDDIEHAEKIIPGGVIVLRSTELEGWEKVGQVGDRVAFRKELLRTEQKQPGEEEAFAVA